MDTSIGLAIVVLIAYVFALYAGYEFYQRFNEGTHEFVDAMQRINNISKAYSELTERFSKTNAMIGELQSQINQKDNKIYELGAKINGKDNKIYELESKVRTTESILNNRIETIASQKKIVEDNYDIRLLDLQEEIQMKEIQIVVLKQVLKNEGISEYAIKTNHQARIQRWTRKYENAELDSLLDELSTFFNTYYNTTEFHNQILHLKSRYSALDKRKNEGLMSNPDYNQDMNNIKKTLINFIKEVERSFRSVD